MADPYHVQAVERAGHARRPRGLAGVHHRRDAGGPGAGERVGVELGGPLRLRPPEAHRHRPGGGIGTGEQRGGDVVVGKLFAPGDVQDPADLDTAGCGPPLGFVEGCRVCCLPPAPGADVMHRRGGDLRPPDVLARQLLGERVGAADQVVGGAQDREAAGTAR